MFNPPLKTVKVIKYTYIYFKDTKATKITDYIFDYFIINKLDKCSVYIVNIFIIELTRESFIYFSHTQTELLFDVILSSFISKKNVLPFVTTEGGTNTYHTRRYQNDDQQMEKKNIST